MDDVWWLFFNRRLATLNERSAVSRTHTKRLTVQTVACRQQAFQAEQRTVRLLADVEQVQQRIRASQREPVDVIGVSSR